MTGSFARAVGRRVVSRATAQELGLVAHLLIDPGRTQVAALVIGKGKNARIVDWDQLSGFGPDAVMLNDEGALREPADERERRAAGGDLELVGKRALSGTGNGLGTIADVTFDPESGRLESLLIGDRDVPPSSLLGIGSYAAVLDITE